MTTTYTLRTLDLPRLTRQAIGFDRMFSDLEDTLRLHGAHDSYPPYNIVRIDDTNFRIELAVAGFYEDEITIEVKDGYLNVQGKQGDREAVNYTFKGISARDFERVFKLADYVEVESATIVNGILSIKLVQNIPEEKQPRKIAITRKE